MALMLCLNLTKANAWVFNNPYPKDEANQKIYYSSFGEQPKTFDPAKSYSSNEYLFMMQIYEPLLQYNYLARPYRLEPLTAAEMPVVRYFDQQNNLLQQAPANQLFSTTYTIRIKPGILYQPHPALAKNKQGRPLYLNLPPGYLDEEEISELSDFKEVGTREVTVDDYIYQIKRLANPAVNSPIYGLMSEHIVGFAEYKKRLPKTASHQFVDLRNYPLEGLRKIDNYSFEIKLKDEYPQFMFWLAMPFFSPVPWEADQFYAQADMDDNDISFDWYPIGTGPFLLSENNPNQRMEMRKNPNFRQEFFPDQGSEADRAAGYLLHAKERLPLIDRAIFTLEKESIPRWNKFLQGYYDESGITEDAFDQAIHINPVGAAELTEAMQKRKLRLKETIQPSIYYLGFNMLDPLVGGNSERARKLRLAVSIAVNYDENIAIFFNGRGQAAQGPIPPSIFGYQPGKKGINPYVYQWQEGKAVRRSLDEAKVLLKEAGYPGGINPETGKALILNYDVSVTGGPDDKAQLDWMRKQFANIGIDLNIRATQYNRFQEKMRTGNAQLFSWGWNADYPDPENFLFMLYGANGKVKHGGENAGNYANPAYDRLFEQMKNRANDEQRQKLIDQMVEILRHDAPWVWGIIPENFVLTHQWVSAVKPNSISTNTLKYVAIDVPLRNQLRKLWNQPILWPFYVLIFLILLSFIPLLVSYFQREKSLAVRSKL